MSKLDLSKEFVGRRALVTGGSRGIGGAIAQRLIDAGAKVVVTARARHETTPKQATFIEADLRTEEGVKKMAAEALRVLGGLDILVNNAGAARVHFPGSDAISDAEWLDSLNINFMAAVRTTNAVLPAIKESKAGVIINVSAVGATPAPGPLMHYSAAKSALNTYTIGLAQELAPQGIRVNILTPGPVLTPGADEIRKVFTDAMKAPPEAMLARVPLRSFGSSEEVAELVALLASDRGRWMTMHNYFIDGGVGAT